MSRDKAPRAEPEDEPRRQISVRLPVSMIRQVKAKAALEDISLQAIIEQQLAQWVAEDKRKG